MVSSSEPVAVELKQRTTSSCYVGFIINLIVLDCSSRWFDQRVHLDVIKDVVIEHFKTNCKVVNRVFLT